MPISIKVIAYTNLQQADSEHQFAGSISENKTQPFESEYVIVANCYAVKKWRVHHKLVSILESF